MGIVGKTWRLLYKSYHDFRCKVRLAGCYSDWYVMRCGIHQGGFLSLLKYAAFIDPLLREIENSGLCFRISNIPAGPVGYADDLSVCSVSKNYLDRALDLVYKYSCKWRFYYNANKSAVMVYGESKREAERNSKFRNFKLGKDKVKEKTEYDHVGVKNCLFGNFTVRTEDRISRGRRAFNSVTSIGIKKKGVCMSVCTTIFWAIIMPIVTYGSELWVLRGNETELLRSFQRYVGRRCQRFPKRSPNYSAYYPLGWISIDRFIKVKKLLFLRTILVMPDDAICKRMLTHKAEIYTEHQVTSARNEFDSPIFEILNVCKEFGIFEKCIEMINGGCYLSKLEWKTMVWDIAWRMEDFEYSLSCPNSFMYRIIDKPYFLTWWIISDAVPSITGDCETMAKLVCNCSLLKDSDYRLKNLSFSNKVCSECDLGIREDVNHLVMQCPAFEGDRAEMFDLLNTIEDEYVKMALLDHQNIFNFLMGKQPNDTPLSSAFKIWAVSSHYITKMYRKIIRDR